MHWKLPFHADPLHIRYNTVSRKQHDHNDPQSNKQENLEGKFLTIIKCSGPCLTQQIPHPTFKGFCFPRTVTHGKNIFILFGVRLSSLELQWRMDLRMNWEMECLPSNWCSYFYMVRSIPDDVTGIFHWHNPSGRTMALGSTQPLTEMSTRNISWV